MNTKINQKWLQNHELFIWRFICNEYDEAMRMAHIKQKFNQAKIWIKKQKAFFSSLASYQYAVFFLGLQWAHFEAKN